MKHEPLHAFQPSRTLIERRARVAVIGGGFTGAAATVALLSSATRPLEILIVEPEGRIGTGLAYGRAGERHLLNVRAQELTIRADRPNDFADWAAESAPLTGSVAANRRAVAQSFLPRRQFADYVRRRLHDAIQEAPYAKVGSTRDAAIQVSRAARGFMVLLRNGGSIHADAVVLATGYGRSFKDRGLGENPFGSLDRERLSAARRVVCVGSGLTMVDALVSLRDAGYRGPVTAVSRRGLLPQPHARESVPTYPDIIAFEPTSASLARAVRHAGATAVRRGVPWQSVVNALRSRLALSWTAFSEEEQARVLRHVWPYWNVHRHRLPPEQHALLARERAAGGLELRRGRVIGVAEAEGRTAVLIRSPGGAVERLEADLVLDCSGARPDVPSTLDAGLERTGLGSRDPHGLGLLVAPNGGLIDRSGAAQKDIFALGPLGFGSLLEITGAPEIVRQADAAARVLAGQLYARGLFAA